MEQLRIPTITLNTGHALPLIGLGTWPLSDAEAAEVVPAALAQGYRLVDTAARYGNEAGVGLSWLQIRPPLLRGALVGMVQAAQHRLGAHRPGAAAHLGGRWLRRRLP